MVGIGIALIGNVPNSILLGRWFGPRLPTAMAVVYSATGAGVSVLLPASQILIDHVGWRDAYQWFGIVALCLLVPLIVLPWRLFAAGSPHVVQEGDTRTSSTTAGPCRARCATTPSGRCSRRSSSPRSAMYAITAQIVAYLIDAGFPPLQAATAWGFSGVVLLFGMLGIIDARRHHRPPAVGAVQLRRLDRRHHPALAAAILSELLAA